MGRSLSIRVKTVHHTGRGSDYYGPCEVCGRSMSEAALFKTHTLHADNDGDVYLSGSSPGLYAHSDCARDFHGEHVVSLSSLPRKGNLIVYPFAALVSDFVRTGLNSADAEAAARQLVFNVPVQGSGQ